MASFRGENVPKYSALELFSTCDKEGKGFVTKLDMQVRVVNIIIFFPYGFSVMHSVSDQYSSTLIFFLHP